MLKNPPTSIKGIANIGDICRAVVGFEKTDERKYPKEMAASVFMQYVS